MVSKSILGKREKEIPILRNGQESVQYNQLETRLLLRPQSKSNGSMPACLPASGYVIHWAVCYFFRDLLKRLRGQILFIWDNGSPHKGVTLREFLRKYHRLHLENFPAYAPPDRTQKRPLGEQTFSDEFNALKIIILIAVCPWVLEEGFQPPSFAQFF